MCSIFACVNTLDACRDTTSMNLITILFTVGIGVLSSGIVAIIVEYTRMPRFKFDILPPEKVWRCDANGKPIESYVSLKVRVSNKPLPFILRWWMQRQSARDCRATLRFLREKDESPFIVCPMVGRWADSVQPVPLHGIISIRPNAGSQSIQAGEIDFYDIDRLTPDSRIHIPAGESEKLDIAVRFPTETDAFGWTNESYRYNFQHPGFRLPAGRYVVEIIVRSEGVKKQECFRIENDHTIEEFRLARL